MGTRRKVTKKQKLEPNIIILWLIYIAIGFMVAYIAHNNLGLDMIASLAIGAGTAMLIVVISEVLDRKLGWSEQAKKKSEPLTASEYIKANSGLGHRALIRGFVEQGGNVDDIKVELDK